MRTSKNVFATKYDLSQLEDLVCFYLILAYGVKVLQLPIEVSATPRNLSLVRGPGVINEGLRPGPPSDAVRFLHFNVPSRPKLLHKVGLSGKS